MDMTNLTGSIVALVTPFKEDKSVDWEALDRLVNFHLENGTDAILVLGTTGESSTMTDREDFEVAKFVIDHVAGRIPVIGGSGSNSTAESMNKSLGLVERGIDGLLLITPYYNKSNEEGIYRHFTTVMDQVSVPCILYNIPGRTGCSISERNLARLREHPNAWAIGSDFKMFSGNDDIIVPLMSLGGSGVISVWANIAPQTVHDLCADWMAGNVEKARKTQIDNLELIHSLFCEVNPIPVKAALGKMGLISPIYRQPLWPMEPANEARVEAALRGAGLLG